LGFITEWIGHMVILVIIMMITTMMLPNDNMRKYAQFSLSLVFILFFIQPITQLFTLNLESEASQIIDSIFSHIPDQEINAAVDLQKKEIQASSDAYVIEELTNQLKKDLEEEFTENFNYHINEIELITEDDKEIDLETITFHFLITESNHQISEVAPVLINTAKTNEYEGVTHSDEDLKMINWFSEKLEIDQTQVQLTREGG